MKRQATYVFFYTLTENSINKIIVDVKRCIRPTATKVYKSLLSKLDEQDEVHSVGYDLINLN